MKRTLLLFLTVILLQAAASCDTLMKWDFEGKHPFHGLSIEGEPPEIVPDPLNPANKVMKATLKTDSQRQERSEVRWDTLKPGQEVWLGVKIMITEPNPQNFICIFQIGPIKYNETQPSTGYIQYLQRAGQTNPNETNWYLRGFFERFGLSAVNQPSGKTEFGKWTNWIAHIRTGAGKDGLIEIWKDEAKIFELKGRIMKENRFVLLPVKWGVYIGVGNKLKQTTSALYDNIIIADESFDLQKMKIEVMK